MSESSRKVPLGATKLSSQNGSGKHGERDSASEQSFYTRTHNEFLGSSPAFNSVMEVIRAIASRECPVIITGETGVGKEMVARQIHAISNRAKHVLVPVDCTTLTGQLFESQLFGHVKGAFTSAVDSTLGFFRAAEEWCNQQGQGHALRGC